MELQIVMNPETGFLANNMAAQITAKHLDF